MGYFKELKINQLFLNYINTKQIFLVESYSYQNKNKEIEVSHAKQVFSGGFQEELLVYWRLVGS